jgi:hypothetical protein
VATAVFFIKMRRVWPSQSVGPTGDKADTSGVDYPDTQHWSLPKHSAGTAQLAANHAYTDVQQQHEYTAQGRQHNQPQTLHTQMYSKSASTQRRDSSTTSRK